MKDKKRKKKIIIIFVIAAAILAVLFVPFVKISYKDGGTVTYSSLTYKIVKWRVAFAPDENNIGRYEKTSVFFIPDCYKSLDELWEIEKANNPGLTEGMTEGTSAE